MTTHRGPSIEDAKNAFTPNIAPAPFVLDRGEGSYAWDREGNRYLDFSTGIAVNSLGHCHPNVVKAIHEQSTQLMHTSNMFWNETTMKLGLKLKEISFADRIFLCNSGTEANEAALKLARKYSYDQGEKRTEILCFHHSFHGRTYGSLSATGQDKYWKGFEPLVPGFKFATFNDPSALASITSNTAAVITEPIQAEAGVFPATQEFLRSLRKRCDDTGALLILDEVQTGVGRTGNLFCYEHYGIKPDLMTLAKGLGGGLPIGALLATEKVASSMVVGSHATTFGGNPVCAASALAVLDVMTTPGFLPAAKQRAEDLWRRLKAEVLTHPRVEDVRGLGFLIGIELKEDISKLFDQLRTQKILVTRIPPRVIRVLPPLTASQEEMTIFIEGFKKALDQV